MCKHRNPDFAYGDKGLSLEEKRASLLRVEHILQQSFIVIFSQSIKDFVKTVAFHDQSEVHNCQTDSVVCHPILIELYVRICPIYEKDKIEHRRSPERNYMSGPFHCDRRCEQGYDEYRVC